jgi:hypothetical protein
MHILPAPRDIEHSRGKAVRRSGFHALSMLLASLISLAVSASIPEPGTAAASIDACALLTDREISQVIGLPVDAGVRKDDGAAADGSYSSTCVWKIRVADVSPADENAPLGGETFVILNAIRWPPGSGLARRFLESFRTAAAKGDIPHQPSPRKFGDEALWWGDGLAVRKQDVSFGVSLFGPAIKAKFPGDFEEQLAPKILRRLPH